MRIIYVDVDSLRADHTEPYGYHRPITPNLAALAKDAVVFDACYCSDSPCVPSRAALWTGQFGVVNGVIGHFGTAAEPRFPRSGARPSARHDLHPTDRPLLGRHLDRHGHHTASISCFAERHLAYWFAGSFRESRRPSDSLGNDEDAADVNRAAIDWLERNGHRPDWLLHLNYWDPHTSYVEPVRWYRAAAEAGPAPAWPDEAAIARHQGIYGPQTAEDLWGVSGERAPVSATMPDAIRRRSDFEHLVNGYDGAIGYWDHRLGQLVDAVAYLGLLQDTAIIVSADHGECLGENGSYAEHGLANEPTHRVPLIIRWPGVTDRLAPSQRRCDALLYQLDLPPTLCELLDIPVPPAWHGTSFAAALRGQAVQGREHLILGQGAHTYQRAVRTRRHLYVTTLHPGAFDAEEKQLYDVHADPHLTTNLLSREPAAADGLKSRLQDWWDRYAGQPGCSPDPMQLTLSEGPVHYNAPRAYLSHLLRTGRQEKAAALRRRLRLEEWC
jgi:arylsulfatase A-like enzyme